MPELPEVEYAAARLREWMQGRRVLRAAAEPSRLLRGESPQEFERRLSGRRLERIERRGKYLLLHFDADAGLLAHLGMTGKLVLRPTGAAERYSRAQFELEDGQTVHFRDPRKFGRLSLAPARDLLSLPEIAALGPDLLLSPPTAGLLRERLGRGSRPIKMALMDQGVVAGLGNIHAAEALFRAELDPRRRVSELSDEALERLALAIRDTLAFAMERDARQAEEISYVEEGGPNPFLVYGKAGETCPRCGGELSSFPQGGRTTYWCPRCQR